MKFIFLLFTLSSCFAHRTIFSGNGISMTRTHLAADEELRDIKSIRAKFCVQPFRAAPRYSTDLIIHAQKAYKADFIRNFKLSEEKVHLFKTCYHLTGIAARAVKDGKSPSEQK